MVANRNQGIETNVVHNLGSNIVTFFSGVSSNKQNTPPNCDSQHISPTNAVKAQEIFNSRPQLQPNMSPTYYRQPVCTNFPKKLVSPNLKMLSDTKTAFKLDEVEQTQQNQDIVKELIHENNVLKRKCKGYHI